MHRTGSTSHSTPAEHGNWRRTLVLIATLSSKLSSRVGLPLLVLFVGIGMLAGSRPRSISAAAYNISPMEHHTPLLITMAFAFVAAFAFGVVASRLRLPPLVGYLAAGVLLGPHTPGFTADPVLASELAEIGVILLMFGVGLHFSTRDLLTVRGIAIPGAVGQIAFATALGALVAWHWGWGAGGALVFGLALSVASTVVVLRAIEERGWMSSANGRIAVAWLVVEDLVMVLALVLLPALAGMLGGAEAEGGGSLVALVAITIGKVAAFLALVSVLGPRVMPWLLHQAARVGSHELFTLAVLAIALGIAYGAAALFGVSFALGAFCAGIVLANSELSHRAAEEALPLQHAFAVIFFVSVGMLFDPTILLRQPLAVLMVVAIIVVGKALAAFAITQALGYPVSTALTVSACLAQIGEFSFILAGLGITLELLPPAGRDLILAGALVSVVLNPLVFRAAGPLADWIRGRRKLFSRFEPGQDLRLARLQAALDAHRAATPDGLARDRLVSRWPVFADLDLEQRSELLSLFRPLSAVPGERLIRRGDDADKAFFISAGTVEVRVGGRRIRLGPGDLFGEMGLLTGEPRSADVIALDYGQFFTLDRDDFERFVGQHPELRSRIDKVAHDRAAMNRGLDPVEEL